MRTPIIAGNWKMNCTLSEAEALVNGIKERLPDVSGVDVVLCPPFTALVWVNRLRRGTPFKLGAQDVFWEESGAFTGQISALMLKEIPCEFVIIGHSERRGRFGNPGEAHQPLSYFAEGDESVNKKVHSALRHDLTPIICVGETLPEREAGRTDEIVRCQVKAALRGVSAEQARRIIFAYEPVWAIGTGKACDEVEANRVIALIRSEVFMLYGAEVSEQVRIQYGGSVTPHNIEALMAQPEIDGALVGGASLNSESFAAIVSAARSSQQAGQ